MGERQRERRGGETEQGVGWAGEEGEREKGRETEREGEKGRKKIKEGWRDRERAHASPSWPILRWNGLSAGGFWHAYETASFPTHPAPGGFGHVCAINKWRAERSGVEPRSRYPCVPAAPACWLQRLRSPTVRERATSHETGSEKTAVSPLNLPSHGAAGTFHRRGIRQKPPRARRTPHAVPGPRAPGRAHEHARTRAREADRRADV